VQRGVLRSAGRGSGGCVVEWFRPAFGRCGRQRRWGAVFVAAAGRAHLRDARLLSAPASASPGVRSVERRANRLPQADTTSNFFTIPQASCRRIRFSWSDTQSGKHHLPLTTTQVTPYYSQPVVVPVSADLHTFQRNCICDQTVPSTVTISCISGHAPDSNRGFADQRFRSPAPPRSLSPAPISTGATAVNFGATGRPVPFTVNRREPRSPRYRRPRAPARSTSPSPRPAEPARPVASISFTYVAAPTVTGITPATGPMAGGTSVTITGTNLSGRHRGEVRWHGGGQFSNRQQARLRSRPRPPAGSVGGGGHHRHHAQRHQRDRQCQPIHLQGVDQRKTCRT